MDLMQGLLERNSQGKLQSPAPDTGQLQQLLQAAARAPDHANLKPWR